MTMRERLTALLAWLQARWSAFLGQWRRKPAGRWQGPPTNRDHEVYREQYDALVPVLPGLPRGDDFEAKRAFMFKAQLEIGLHNYGDHPALSEVAATPETLGTQRLAAFGPVGQPSGIMSLLAGWKLWAIAGAALAALSATGWASSWINDKRADRAERQRNEFREAAEANARAAQEWRAQYENAHRSVIAAQEQSAATAQTIERERRIRRRAENEARSIRDAVEQARIGGPVDYGFGSVRDDRPDAGAAPGGGAANGGDPR